MAGSFARFHLPRMRLWERSVALLRTKAAKLSDGKLSTPLLAEQRLDTPDKARSRRVSFRSAHSLIRGQDVGGPADPHFQQGRVLAMFSWRA